MLTTTYPIVPKKVQINALNSTHLAQYYQDQLGFTHFPIGYKYGEAN